MIEKKITLPTLALVAGTRVALGLGVGLLLADRLTPEQRRAAGLALLAVGALTTIPLAAQVLRADSQCKSDELAINRNSIAPYVTAAHEGGAL